MTHPSITTEQVLSKKEYAHFTKEQAQEFIDSITMLCEIIYQNIKQNFDLLSDKGVNWKQSKEYVNLAKAA